jgi:ubiquinone/menaquinone biosynthesis C-methylase UbiE
VARERAGELGVHNVEFQQLELEWIDVDTASIDAVLCRWGIMLIVDPVSAAREIRRILRSGGRAAFAVWDVAERNPWATIPGRVMIAQGHAAPPDPDAPGQMFSLGDDGVLQELLEGAGFEDVVITPVALQRRYDAVARYVEETIDMSPMFSSLYAGLDAEQQGAAAAAITAAVQPFVAADGSVLLPGSSLVASAAA